MVITVLPAVQYPAVAESLQRLGLAVAPASLRARLAADVDDAQAAALAGDVDLLARLAGAGRG